MNSTSDAESTVIIQKLSLEYSIPKHYLLNKKNLSTDTERRLRKISTTKLPEVLAGVFSEMENRMPNATDAIIILKTLELDFDLDTSLSEAEIVHLWAEKIRKHFIKIIGRKNSQQIIYFANKALYLKAFLCDLTQGQAWQKWYYRHFSGLRSLPTSMATRTALLDDITTGLMAFSHMSTVEMEHVIHSLNKQDVQSLLTAWQLPESNIDGAINSKALVGLMIPILFEINTRHFEINQQIVFVFLQIQKLEAQKKLTQNRNSVLTLTRLTVNLAHLFHYAPHNYAHILTYLRSKNLNQLKRSVTPEQLLALLPATGIFGIDLTNIIEALEKFKAPKTPALQLNEYSATQFSYFGNALILLPIIDQWHLEALTHNWEGCGNSSAANLLRLLIFSACQGKLQFSKAVRDPLIRDLCAIEHHLLLSDMVAWINAITEDKNNTLLNSIALDAANDTAAIFHAPITINNECNAEQKSAQNTQHELYVYLENRKGRWLNLKNSSFTNSKPLANILNGSTPTTDQKLIDKIQADFDSLWLGKSIHSHTKTMNLNNNSCLLLTLLAQNILKSFAYRLPGFAHSSSTYLLRNFLCMSVTLIKDNHASVSHTSRVPMSVLLNMTGLNRGLVELPWLKNSAPHYHTIRMHEAAS